MVLKSSTTNNVEGEDEVIFKSTNLGNPPSSFRRMQHF
jgi:hypothetical protein